MNSNTSISWWPRPVYNMQNAITFARQTKQGILYKVVKSEPNTLKLNWISTFATVDSTCKFSFNVSSLWNAEKEEEEEDCKSKWMGMSTTTRLHSDRLPKACLQREQVYESANSILPLLWRGAFWIGKAELRSPSCLSSSPGHKDPC